MSHRQSIALGWLLCASMGLGCDALDDLSERIDESLEEPGEKQAPDQPDEPDAPVESEPPEPGPAPAVPEGDWDQVVDVAAGMRHTCVVDVDGRIHCWGDDEFGQTEAPEGRFEKLAAGGEHTCGIDEEGGLVCWGRNEHGQIEAPDGTFRDVAVGYHQTCAIDESDRLYCWGAPDTRPPDMMDRTVGEIQAGAGDDEVHRVEGEFRDVGAGLFHVCATDQGGRLDCWQTYKLRNEEEAETEVYQQVAAGNAHTCALDTEGGVRCWGQDQAGLLDVPDRAFRTISAGLNFTCGITTDDRLECWGLDRHGEASPVELFPGVDRLATGGRHGCAIAESGELFCWGDNSYGQARPPGAQRFRPAFRWLTAGDFHTCGMVVGGGPYCQGDAGDDAARIVKDILDPAKSMVGLAGGRDAVGLFHRCNLDGLGFIDCSSAVNGSVDDFGQAREPAVFVGFSAHEEPGPPFVDEAAGVEPQSREFPRNDWACTDESTEVLGEWLRDFADWREHRSLVSGRGELPRVRTPVLADRDGADVDYPDRQAADSDEIYVELDPGGLEIGGDTETLRLSADELREDGGFQKVRDVLERQLESSPAGEIADGSGRSPVETITDEEFLREAGLLEQRQEALEPEHTGAALIVAAGPDVSTDLVEQTIEVLFDVSDPEEDDIFALARTDLERQFDLPEFLYERVDVDTGQRLLGGEVADALVRAAIDCPPMQALGRQLETIPPHRRLEIKIETWPQAWRACGCRVDIELLLAELVVPDGGRIYPVLVPIAEAADGDADYALEADAETQVPIVDDRRWGEVVPEIVDPRR